MREKIIAHLKKQSFVPSFWAVFINPYYITRRHLYKELAYISLILNRNTLLDIGCGRKPYKSTFKVDFYVGLDVHVSGHSEKAKNSDVMFDGTNIPIKANSFDCVLATEVLEHVFEPDEFLFNVSKILKPGGRLILSVPFVWDEHEQPYDYARYTSFGIKYLLEKHKFKLLHQKKTGGYIETLSQLLCSYLISMPGSNKNVLIKMAIQLFLCAPITILGIITTRLLPKNDNLFLDNIILAEKTTE